MSHFYLIQAKSIFFNFTVKFASLYFPEEENALIVLVKTHFILTFEEKGVTSKQEFLC